MTFITTKQDALKELHYSLMALKAGGTVEATMERIVQIMDWCKENDI